MDRLTPSESLDGGYDTNGRYTDVTWPLHKCGECGTDRPTFGGGECGEYPTDLPTFGAECVTRVGDSVKPWNADAEQVVEHGGLANTMDLMVWAPAR